MGGNDRARGCQMIRALFFLFHVARAVLLGFVWAVVILGVLTKNR